MLTAAYSLVLPETYPDIFIFQEVERKTAVDAEADDQRDNMANEAYFVISGLNRLSSELRGKDWHEAAKAQVQTYLVEVMGRELQIDHVVNVSSRAPDASARYQVKLETPELSRQVTSLSPC